MSVMHEIYLPFHENVLREHFAPVKGQERTKEKYLKHYRDSIKFYEEYRALVDAGLSVPSSLATRGPQIEKDERFWAAAALMAIHHPVGGQDPGGLYAELLGRSGAVPPEGGWGEALKGKLYLFFEVSLPSPRSYSDWLRANVDDHAIVPFLHTAATTATKKSKAKKLEGATKADAMLLAPETGTAVVFEAKVLSDVSPQVRYDLTRNQLARIIDVSLEWNPVLRWPLTDRNPERTYVVLLTPRSLSPDTTVAGGQQSRLYGWLMPGYQDPSTGLLAQHLPHRTGNDLAGVSSRLGWLNWVDVEDILPGACRWLSPRHR